MGILPNRIAPDTAGAAPIDGRALRARLALPAALSIAFLVVYAWWQIDRWGGPQHTTLLGDLFFIPLNLGAVVTAWGASRRCRDNVRLRRSWQLLALALLFYLLGDVGQTYSEVVAHNRPFPSWADVGYLCFYPLMLTALLRFPTARRTAHERLMLVLDCAMIAVAGAVPIWYLSLGPIIAAGGQDALAMSVSVAYPIGDMVLLVGLATLLFRTVQRGSRTALNFVGAGLLGFVATDLVYGWLLLHRGYAGGDRIDAGWMVSLVFFVLAGAAQTAHRRMPNPTKIAPRQLRVSWLPYVGLASTLAIVIFIERDDDLTTLMVFVAAVLLAALVSVRQMVVQAQLLVTERRLRESQADRTMLLDRTLRQGEDERVRIATELHDGPVQRLASLGYLLERAVRLTHHGDTAEAVTVIERALGDLSGEVNGLRRLMSDLRPPVLDQSGLENALRDHLAVLFRETAVTVDFVSELGTERVPAETETVLYRVAQEALLNVLRHARASTVRVRLTRTPGGVILAVTDDGVGFSPAQARDRSRDGHFGLIGMRERIELGGGSWQLDTAPQRGTRITAHLPDPKTAHQPTEQRSAHESEVPA